MSIRAFQHIKDSSSPDDDFEMISIRNFQTCNKNCPSFIKEYFKKKKKENPVTKKYDLKIPIRNSATFVTTV